MGCSISFSLSLVILLKYLWKIRPERSLSPPTPAVQSSRLGLGQGDQFLLAEGSKGAEGRQHHDGNHACCSKGKGGGTGTGTGMLRRFRLFIVQIKHRLNQQNVCNSGPNDLRRQFIKDQSVSDCCCACTRHVCAPVAPPKKQPMLPRPCCMVRSAR